MSLKRNVLTILFSFMFIIIMGVGFAQILYLAISASQDRNVIACIIILGIIIYLIIAFLLKEGQKVQFFQKRNSVLQISEAGFALVVAAGAFLLNMETDIENGITVALLLLLLYGCGKLLGGRLCAVVSLCTGFFFFLVLSSANYETDHTLDILCFLVPYFVFLLITGKLTELYIKQPFLIVISYVMLGVLFALAVILNPLAVILLLGCFLSLLFGKTKEKGSIFTAGPFLALILLLISVAVMVGVWFLMPDMITPVTFDMDLTLKQMHSSYVDAGRYLLTKYLQSGNLLYLTTETGIFPAILFFFAGLSGYYAIRKKASAITPLCFAYLVSVFYHLIFLGSQNEFYYMFYFLPLFSAYGIYNTLIPEESSTSEETEAAAGPDTAVTEETDEQDEAVPPEKPEEPVPIPAPVPIPTPKPKRSVVLQESNTEQEQENLVVSEKKEKRSAKRKQSGKPIQEALEPVVPQPSSDMQDWTVSEKYLSGYKESQKRAPKPDNSVTASSPEINVSIPEISIPEVPVPEISEPVISLPEASESVISLPEASESVISLPEESEPAISLPQESESVISLPEESEPAGLEQDIPAPATIESGAMEFDDQDDLQLVQDEPVFTDSVDQPEQAEISENKIAGGTDANSSLLSEDNLSAKDYNDGRGESIEISSEFDNDADAQLSTLLNRLDISDNIRRMNESAREDIADIIERDDTKNELNEAKPAEEFDYEIPEEPNEKIHEPLPKYVKPDFDFPIEPMSQPLLDTQDQISEYDKVPTIKDLERKWRDINETPKEEAAEEETTATQYSFAYSLEDVADAVAEESPQPEKADTSEKPSQEAGVHSEEIIKKNGMGKRSYHKLTIR